MDVSTIYRYITQTWSIRDDGELLALLSATSPSYSCMEHELNFADWAETQAHCEEFHPEIAQPSSNGVPSDGTVIAESHQVSLEEPND